MSKLILLLWISIIVILNVRGEDIIDNSKLCELCSSNTLPECIEANDMVNISTIHCKKSEETLCIIAIAEGKNEENYMCLIKQRELLGREGSNVMEEQYTTIKVEPTMSDDNKVNEGQAQDGSQLENSTQSVVIENSIKHSVTESTISAEQEMNDMSVTLENTQLEMNAVTVKQEVSIVDQVLIIASTPNSEPENISSEVKEAKDTDISELPQADQAMPEVKAENDKPIIEIDNDIESRNVEEISEPIKSEDIEKTMELEPKINSIDNLDTVTSTKNMPICFACVSTEDANCITKPTREKMCKTVDETPVGCYTLHKDSQLMRGCLEDLDASQTALCLNGMNKSCYVCYGKNCNDESWPQCYICNSNPENALCAQWEPQASFINLKRLCAAFDDVCQLEITENGGTVRSCAAKTYTCDMTQEANCKVCNTSLCNGGIFPTGRLRCHQCADATNCTLEQTIHTALPCPIFIKDDSCYLYVNDVGNMQRGCTSSIEDFKSCMEYSENRCLTCTTLHGCNSQPLMLEAKLSCSKCDTRVKNNPSSMECAWAQSAESVSTCKNKFLYYVEETCELIYEPDIELAVRGCSHDIGMCESSYNGCSDCKTSACNIGNLVWQNCLQCSSKQLSSCHVDLKGVISKKCSSLKQSYEERGCYTIVNFDTNITTRGCISDLTDEEKNYCKTNKKHCVFCYEQGCNNRLASSSGNRVFMENDFRLLFLGLIYSCL